MVLVTSLGSLWGCEEPRPRTFTEYLGDSVAREATLVRCNANRAATLDDLECRNARRAAAAIAAQAEAERRAELEAQSERKRAAVRERIAAQQEAARRAAEAARRAAEAAYDEQFLYGGTKLDAIQPPPTDGEAEAPMMVPQPPPADGAVESPMVVPQAPPTDGAAEAPMVVPQPPPTGGAVESSMVVPQPSTHGEAESPPAMPQAPPLGQPQPTVPTGASATDVDAPAEPQAQLTRMPGAG